MEAELVPLLPPSLFTICLWGVFLLFGISLFYKWVMQTRFLYAFAWTMLAAVLTEGIVRVFGEASRSIMRDVLYAHTHQPMIFFAFVVFLLAFGLNLFKIWIHKPDGGKDVPKSFCLGNIVLVLGLSLSGSPLFGWNPIVIAVVFVSVLAAYPLLKTDAASSSSSSLDVSEGEESVEKARVLKMLEAGTINPTEASELLAALGGGASHRSQRGKSKADRLRIMGAALVGFSFFMTWFVINTNDMMKSAFNSVSFEQAFSGMPGMGNQPQLMQERMPNMTIRASGADVNHGLGWIILLLAVSVPVMLWFFDAVQRDLHLRLEKIAAFSGALLLLYVLSSGYRYASLGILFALAGYAVLIYAVTRPSIQN